MWSLTGFGVGGIHGTMGSYGKGTEDGPELQVALNCHSTLTCPIPTEPNLSWTLHVISSSQSHRPPLHRATYEITVVPSTLLRAPRGSVSHTKKPHTPAFEGAPPSTRLTPERIPQNPTICDAQDWA